MIAEGAMGLFDGAPPLDFASGSAADIARLTGWPVVLILDVSGQGQSAAALARGAALHDPDVALAGVVLNKVASERHRKLCADAIEAAGIRCSARCPGPRPWRCRSATWGSCRQPRPKGWPSASRNLPISSQRMSIWKR